MGATRPASGMKAKAHRQHELCPCLRTFAFMPDAGRVAPISGSVSSSIKHHLSHNYRQWPHIATGAIFVCTLSNKSEPAYASLITPQRGNL